MPDWCYICVLAKILPLCSLITWKKCITCNSKINFLAKIVSHYMSLKSLCVGLIKNKSGIVGTKMTVVRVLWPTEEWKGVIHTLRLSAFTPCWIMTTPEHELSAAEFPIQAPNTKFAIWENSGITCRRYRPGQSSIYCWIVCEVKDSTLNSLGIRGANVLEGKV